MKNKIFSFANLVFFAAVSLNAQTASLTKNESADTWKEFKTPVIVFNNEDTTADGKLFADYISNPDSLERAVDLKVCKLLYKKTEEIPVVTKIVLTVKNMDGVAYTSGLEIPTEKTTVFSSKYLKSTIARLKDRNKIINEIDGVITHETVHIYQHSSKNDSPDHGSVIEGIADAIRYYAGVDSITRRKKGGNWTGAYTITGFFIVWLQEKYDPDFLYNLNKYVGEVDEFHWNDAMLKLVNKPVQTLWDEYQAAI